MANKRNTVMVNKRWRLLDLEFSDPFMNLAVEEAIPRALGKGITSFSTLRFWRNPNTIVIGRFQNQRSEVNFHACKKYGTNIVRRFTGGGAVYQDLGNLNYAISISRDNPLVTNDILETSEILSQGIMNGLALLGIRAKYKRPNGLFVGDRKISGSAGAVKWGIFFHHGTLLVNSNLKVLSEVLSFQQDGLGKSYVHSVPHLTTSLENELKKEISIENVKDSLIKGFRETYHIDFVKGDLLREEKELAKNLYSGRCQAS